MEIDLDNLVFDGLEEAQERNAERLEDADKKAQEIIADNDCGDACKIWFPNRRNAGFFFTSWLCPLAWLHIALRLPIVNTFFTNNIL